jgi:ABC-type phosphate transport system substrate-binding protein
MKSKTNFWVLLVIASLSTAASVNAQDNITIRSAKFVTPLVEKWITEYSKSHPRMQIRLSDGKDAADIQVSVYDNQETSDNNTVARYAILPIAGKNNSIATDLQKKKLNAKRLKELYFEKDYLDEDYDPDQKDKYNATVYASNNQLSVANAFASHFGYDASSLKGKKIAGDDIFVNHAIAKDASGVSFNNLNYVFDISSRRLKEEITILPLDVKKEFSEILSEANLDKTIELLETRKIDLIPVEELRLEISDAGNPEIQKFLQWVQTEGQAFNHEFGFLKLEDSRLANK